MLTERFKVTPTPSSVASGSCSSFLYTQFLALVLVPSGVYMYVGGNNAVKELFIVPGGGVNMP